MLLAQLRRCAGKARRASALGAHGGLGTHGPAGIRSETLANWASLRQQHSNQDGHGGSTGDSESSGWFKIAGTGLGVAGLTLAVMKGPKVLHSDPPTPKEEAPSAPSPPTDSAPSLPVAITSMNKTHVPHLPQHVQYLLVGAGTASFAAFRAIKATEPKAQVLMVGDEKHVPYMRPPLSKELWFSESVDQDSVSFTQWNGRSRSLYFEPEPFFTPLKELTQGENGGISVVQGRRVVRVDPELQEAELDNGAIIRFDKCLLATGGKPKRFPLLERNELFKNRVSTFRSVADFFRLNEQLQHMKRIAIVGGGFLGSELACALAYKSKKTFNSQIEVIQIFPEAGNMGKVLPDYLSQWTTEKVKAEGVNVLAGREISAADVDASTGDIVLTLGDDQKVQVDHVIVAIGLEANTDLAKSSRLEVDSEFGGFRVNAELEARTNVYAAGDAASYFDVILGRRRVEHHDHAITSGRQAGLNMVGQSPKPYTHQSMFWSDLGPDVGYEAVGIVDSSLPTVGVFAHGTAKDTPKAAVTKSDEAMRSESQSEPPSESSPKESPPPPAPLAGEKYGKGVVFYLKDDIVVGVLMWNVFNRVTLARRIIKENKKYEDLADLAKLFDIHRNDDDE